MTPVETDAQPLVTYEDPVYRYRVAYQPNTGVYVRTSVLDQNLRQTSEEAFRGSYPHLLDIGIMGHCLHGASGKCAQSGVECYQQGNTRHQPHMRYEDFCRIIDESRGKTFQVALGGRGDPDQHPDFVKMIRYACESGVTPNFTTSGYDLDQTILPDIKQYCGAVAVSHYRSRYTTRAIQALLAHGIKTNIHFVLSSSSIDEAIDWIEGKKVPRGINRVIFLLHKPVGNGSRANVLSVHDPRVRRFYEMFNQEENCAIAGFDTCTAPALLHFAPRILKETYDTCEGGRFSAYVSPDMKLLPCSFDTAQNHAVDLRSCTIAEAFSSESFDRFRTALRRSSDSGSSCAGCPSEADCRGGCPLLPEIVLCPTCQNHGGAHRENQH